MAIRSTDCLIIGAGFSGIAMGIELQKKGISQFMIIEKAHRLGGTWFHNTYPGAGCDIPSVLYSYSFAVNLAWTSTWVRQPEIQAYMEETANRFGMMEKIRFLTECIECRWDTISMRWFVKVKNLKTGEIETIIAKVVVAASGMLNAPNDPPCKGAETFQGPIFHSARWRHDVDLKNKDVIVIGAGCSAIQFVPVIAKQVKSLNQFMRRPHMIDVLPIPNWTYSSAYLTLLSWFPFLAAFFRICCFLILDFDFTLFYSSFGYYWRQFHTFLSNWYTRKYAPAQYVDMLIPKYDYGVKRRLFDDGYLDALHLENVNLSNSPIDTIVPDGILTKSGQKFKADVIIYANGFKVEEFLFPIKVIGDNGVSLSERWKSQGGARAYLGGYIPNCPNFVIVMGPNTYNGHHSIVFGIECMTRYAANLFEPILKGQKSVVKVKQSAEKRYDDWVQRETQKLIVKDAKNAGWYLDSNGRNSAIFPCYQTRFWWNQLWIKKNDFSIY